MSLSEVTVRTRDRKQGKPSAKGIEHTHSLVLDDFLATIGQVRRQFQLPAPKFGLKEIERYPRARETVETLILSTIDRCGNDVSCKHNSLLSEISTDVYLKRFVSSVYSGWRISPNWIPRCLEKLLEISLQTLTQLPTKDPRLDYSPRRLKSLTTRLRKLGDETDSVLHEKLSLDRIRAYFAREKSETDEARLLLVAGELRWAADTLNMAITCTRVARPKMNSPNPQVRLALYIVGWFEASTGREQYAPLETLVTAAFSAAGKETPRWAVRLAVEMHLHRRRRRRWARGLRRSVSIVPILNIPGRKNT